MKTILIFGATGTLGAYISLHFHGIIRNIVICKKSIITFSVPNRYNFIT